MEDRDLLAWVSKYPQDIRFLSHAGPTAACTLIRRENQILAVARKDGSGQFSMPGGHIEQGESFRAAAMRETLEETGVIPRRIFPIFFAECGTFLCATYGMEVSGEPSSPEGVIVDWKDPSILVQSPFGEYNRALFKYLGIKY
ncbi:MAG TPA: NUDIX domain-containing protein [Methylobacter sp.]|jgi:8-oxo-dGTP pyrophosphatase MutT (NUDIX family)